MSRASRSRVALATVAACVALIALDVPAGAAPTPSPAPHATAKPGAKAPAAKSSAKPAPAANGPGSALTNGQFTVETDETDYDLKTGDFDMPHHVHFTRPGTDVVGDRAHGNTRNNTITIDGNVVLHQTGAINSLGSGAQRLTAQEPSTLTTDELQVDGKTKTYTAIGNVKWTQGNKLLTADHGVLNEVTHQLTLQGNVHIEEGEQSMDADTVHYDTATEKGNALGSPVIARMPVASPPPATPGPTAKPKARRRR